MLAILAMFVLAQAQTALSDSHVIPLPEGVQFAQRCDTPVLERMGLPIPQEYSDVCIEMDMTDYPRVVEHFVTWFDDNNWVQTSQNDSVRIFQNRSAPPGCTQSLLFFPAPPSRGVVRDSSAPDDRPWDGEGLLLLLPVFSQGCER